MGGFEIGLRIDPFVARQILVATPVAGLQDAVDMLALVEAEAREMSHAEAFGQFLDDEEIGAHRGRRLDELRPHQDMLLAAGPVKVVVLDEHGGRQDDIGNLSRIGHELLVHRHEQVVAQEAFTDETLFRRYVHRVGVLDQQRRHRPTAAKSFRIAGQHPADLRLVELADIRIGVSGAHHSDLLSRKISPLLWKAPPPSYCQQPSTVEIDSAACMATVPLRWRAKP